MAVLTKAPGDDYPGLNDGDTLQFLAGVHQPYQFPEVGSLTLVPEQPGQVVVEGSIVPSGGEDPCTWRFLKNPRLRVMPGFELRNSDGRNFRMTDSPDAVVQGVVSWHAQIEAFIFGNCPRLLFEDCVGHTSRNGSITSMDRKHAVYFSGDMADSVARRFHGYDCTGSAQWNGASLKKRIERFTAEDFLLERMGYGGSSAVMMMGTSNSTLRRFRVKDARVLLLREYDDGEGAQWACFDNTYEAWDIQGNPGGGVDITPGSEGAKFVAWTGFTPPGMLPGPVTPAPAPGPPPTPLPPPLSELWQQVAIAVSGLRHHAHNVKPGVLRDALQHDADQIAAAIAAVKERVGA